ncbi:hypothetical protein AVEN_193106-1 [Araneus ventricosus]|uniref:H15 domain-containing protein n=1 Tax=Araneus ventricosus TaxID=182803 RepID=A0A4Y2B0J5_ARAVE|nr:hypothetical protein AVEN_193106-1 [Araneus ventricosus]
MEAPKVDKDNKEANAKAEILRWILKAIEDMEGSNARHIQKFLDSKQTGILNTPELKPTLKKILDSGLLIRNGGRYFINKSSKTSEKGIKKFSCKKSN